MSVLIGTNNPDFLEASTANFLMAGLGDDDLILGNSGNNGIANHLRV
jgi:hypothetical protein